MKSMNSRTFSRKKAQTSVNVDEIAEFKGHEDCLDICLTTNMFQVGIDVDRLGLMLINGQSKSNSEYIQASAVSAEIPSPGLAVSLLRSTKPRDLSPTRCRSFHQNTVMSTSPPQHRSVPAGSCDAVDSDVPHPSGLETTKENDGIRELVYPAKKKEWPFWISSSKAS